MLECVYSIYKPEIKKEEREVYDEVASDVSHYIDGKILKKIKRLYN